MAAIHALILFSILALAAAVFANPAARPKPFLLPATYVAGGVSIDFNEDGTFKTTRSVPPLPCDKPVCPGRIGQGHWSWATGSGWLTLRQTIGEDWTVNQVWRLGAASSDKYSSVITGNRLVRAMGERSDEFPLARNAANWKRTRFPPSNATATA